MKKLKIILYTITALSCIGFLTACVASIDTSTPSISLDKELYDNNVSFTETLNFYQNEKLYGSSGDTFYFHLTDANKLDINKEESNSLFHFTLSDTYNAQTNTLKISSLILDKNYNYFSLTGSGLGQGNTKIFYGEYSNSIGMNYFETGASFVPVTYILHFTYLDGKTTNPSNVIYTNYKFNFYQVLVEEAKGTAVSFHLTKDNKLETCHCYHNKDALFYIVLSEDFNKTTSSTLKIKSLVLNKNFEFISLRGTSGPFVLDNVEANTEVINTETMYYPSTYIMHFVYQQ